MMLAMNQIQVRREPRPDRNCNASESKANHIRVESGSPPDRTDEVKLAPRVPPGRRNRKGRAFEAEIARLRAAGYTLEAIREALAAAGVHVSKSTVQREAARRSIATRTPVPTAPPPRPGPVHASPTQPLPAGAVAAPARAASTFELRSGRDIAEVFMRGRITNPLVRDSVRNKEPQR